MGFLRALCLLGMMVLCGAHSFGHGPEHFMSLKATEVNLRSGPGKEYEVTWIYKRSGLPVRVLRDYNFWMYIRDCDGTEGWIQQNLLCKKKAGLVLEDKAPLRSSSSEHAKIKAYLQKGVLVFPQKVEGPWVFVSVPQPQECYTGWVLKKMIWGDTFGPKDEK